MLNVGGEVGTASAYVLGMELTDPDTAVADTVTGTRFYTFGGATAAVRTAQGLHHELHNPGSLAMSMEALA